MNILIAGATGNLGSLLTKHLLSSPHQLRLLTHKRALPFDLPLSANAEIVRGDLNDLASLRPVCANIDCIVYLAGVLFQPHPQEFLHRTNTIYTQNLVDAALAAGPRSPLTRDMIERGMTSVIADTSRMKKEIVAHLRYPASERALRFFDYPHGGVSTVTLCSSLYLGATVN